MNGETFIEVFKFAPAIAALLFVIYLMYKIICKKDQLIEDIVKGSEEEINRQSRMLTLLEILVDRAKE